MIIRPEAEADLANAQGWYEWQREGLGAEFLLCVEEVFERIGRMPELHPVVYRGVRRAITRRFPHSIYYLQRQGAHAGRAEGDNAAVPPFHLLPCRGQ